jgi:uncharacterized DUF497 family protein
MDFEWDDAKAESKERKHGVTFTEAMTVFANPLSVTGYDPGHADDEDRFLTMGMSVSGRLLPVAGGVAHGSWRCGPHHQCSEGDTTRARGLRGWQLPLTIGSRPTISDQTTTSVRCAAWSVGSTRTVTGSVRG